MFEREKKTTVDGLEEEEKGEERKGGEEESLRAKTWNSLCGCTPVVGAEATND